MSEEHGFEFDTDIMPAKTRDESITRETGDEVLTMLQAKLDAKEYTANPAYSPLLLLGAALYTYDVWSLPALLEHANIDPNPPAHVEEILPFARQFIE